MTENGLQRQLKAIFSADVKGYSKLMGEDDESTVNTITAYREIISNFVEKHQGRVVDSPGDNILAEFGSPLNAVNSAIAIQQCLEKENEKLSDDRRMQFRIGINLGDIIHKGDRIYGDGVNVAARIESLADPGGISISRSVFDQVKKKVRQGFEYLGEHEVKNISEPVRIYRILLKPEFEGKVINDQSDRKSKIQKPYAISIALILVCSISILWLFYPRLNKIQAASIDNMAFPLPEKPSIVVLPFDNMSNNSQEDYFSDGITEQIITTLSRYPRLFVIARQSAFRYKGQTDNIQKVAEDLGVQYVLRGGVQKSGNKVRINVQLIDAISGNYIWSERYDKELEDLFALQDEITLNVMNGMSAELTEGEQARLWTKKVTNLKALEKHYQAQGYFCLHTKENYEKARPLFEEAIAIDPNFVWPYVYLGYLHNISGLRGYSEDRAKSFQTAFDLAQKALAIDESHDGVHSLLSQIYLIRRDYDKAISEAERAVALNPNGSDAYMFLMAALGYSGRWEESVPYGEKCLRLSPFPGAAPLSLLGRVYFMTGHYNESIATLKKALNVSPNILDGHVFLAACYVSIGREEEAYAEVKKALKINPKFSIGSYAKRLPFKSESDVERILLVLRKAGFPEGS